VNLAVVFAIFGLFFPFTIYLQSQLGMSPLQAGLTSAPFSVTAFFVAPFAGRLSDVIGGKRIVLTGLGTFAIGIAWIASAATLDSTWQTFVLPLMICGCGVACLFSTTASLALHGVELRQAGAASGVLSTMSQLGGVLGAAVTGALLQSQLGTTAVVAASFVEAMRPTLAAPCVVLVSAALLCVAVDPRARTAATQHSENELQPGSPVAA
jgi:MFS family permease